METLNKINLDEFVKSYLATSAWIKCDSDECQTFTKEAIESAKKDCKEFIKKVAEKFGEEKAIALLTTPGNDLPYLAPHDFFLTRNRHGAGFWDKEEIYGEAESIALTNLSHEMKESNVYHIRGKKSKLTFD